MVRIQLNNKKLGNNCYLSSEKMEELQLKENGKYTLSLGKDSREVIFYELKSEQSTLIISKELFRDVSLDSAELNIWKQGNTIKLGPVVAVFMNEGYTTAIGRGKVPMFIHNHEKASMESKCMSYYFSIHDVDWTREKIYGYRWIKDEWKKEWMPLPDVLYDYGASFMPWEKELVKEIRTKLKSQIDIRTINSKDYLGKWNLYKALAALPEVQDYLPETKRYQTFQDLVSMLEEHNYIFLKSYYGSRGLEVMSIEKVQNKYIVNFLKQQLEIEKLETLDELKKCIDNFLKEDKRYIIQQGIKVLKYKDRRFDIRVLMEKDRKGQWVVGYDSVNLALPESTITTFRGDGRNSYCDIYDGLLEQEKDIPIPSEKQIHDLATSLCLAIEEQIGYFGELGLDMAIDETGKLWFIEANTKPDKFPYPGQAIHADVGTRPFLCTLEYAKYLSMGMPKNRKAKYDKLTIKKRENDGDVKRTIGLPKEWHRYLSPTKACLLKIGMFKTEVQWEESSSEDVLEFSNDIIEEFDGLLDKKVNVELVGTTLRIGPVIGVFISNGNVRRMKRQRPKFRQIEFMKANKDSNTILYFFSIKDVNFIHRKIYGMYYSEKDKRWQRLSYPLPDVLYDRGGGVLSKQIIKSDYIREQLRLEKKMKKFNPQYFFDKWDTYKKLVNQPEMAPYLPETEIYNGIDSLKKMLGKHSTVYIKDCHGSNGKGILRISETAEGYKYSFVKDKETYTESVKRIEDLIPKINLNLYDKKVIIQQAIDLLTHKGRIIDLRSTVQRNGAGELEMISFPVRIGKKGSPITSSQSGSEIYEIDYFFLNYLNYSPIELKAFKKRIEEFIKTSYVSIEREYGVFGEIGIDFAFDKDKQIWFIECNAKPGYDCMYKSYDEDTIRRTFSNPLEYAKNITNFQS
ncbi:YheC/YheD family protein [Evansella sp. AB-P1]|uniref:YheC/YheD family endospore coat-associated protein n=1 Tax=Evansella sp. AB-P1 TaxID=3037653 RepID=UPI00241D83F1|nr:YheC/YheD family protein [Evansella sp. AB-P1]MDG5788820.1 YheC/YheD family protein [Evansella sp. AB-P1]